MRLSLDASALAKKYIEEAGSDQLDGYLQQASELAVAVIIVPEIISALNRRRREKRLNHSQYRQVKQQLLYDLQDATILQITPEVIAESVRLLEAHVLRAMDALHVACALQWQAELLATADQRQLSAARAEGLATVYIG